LFRAPAAQEHFLTAQVHFCLAVQEGPALCHSFHVGSAHFFIRIYFVGNPELHTWHRLLELVVAAHPALYVYRHPRGHQPGHRAYSKVEPRLCLVYGKLIFVI